MENKSSMTKYFILSALQRKEMHGYELITDLEKITGKKPSASQIYPVMKKMHSAGYVSVITKKIGKKKINIYSITKTGKQLFLIISKRFDAIIASALKDKIKICAHCNCELISGAVKKKNLYFCCESCAKSFNI